MKSSKEKISRPMVAVLAAGLLLSGMALAVMPHAKSAVQWDLLQGACVRVGLVMAALWLALPLLERDGGGGRIFGGFFVAVMLAFVFLRRVPLRVILPIAVALGTLGFALRPRPKRRPGSRP